MSEKTTDLRIEETDFNDLFTTPPPPPPPSPDIEGDFFDEDENIPFPDSDDNDIFETLDEEPQPEKEGLSTEARKRSAKMVVRGIDYLTANLCGVYSGRGPKQYKSDQEDLKELTDALADYLDYIDADPGPTAVLVVMLATSIGVRAMQAHEDKKTDAPLNAMRQQRARMDILKQQREAGEISDDDFKEESIDFNLTKPKKDRVRFEIDADDLYMYYPKSKGGKYIQKEDRTETPSAEILAIIREGKAANLSDGQINQNCRKFLYQEA